MRTGTHPGILANDPYRDLKDVLERLPTQPASRLEQLLPHRWTLLQTSH
jgi:transposase